MALHDSSSKRPQHPACTHPRRHVIVVDVLEELGNDLRVRLRDKIDAMLLQRRLESLHAPAARRVRTLDAAGRERLPRVCQDGTL